MTDTTIQDIVINQGADAVVNFTHIDTDGITPFSLVGYTVSLMVRKTVDAATTLLSYTTSGINPAITITGLGNNVATVDFAAVDSSAILFRGDELQGVYQVEIVKNSVTTRTFEGNFTISKEVVR